jgi:XTP/dITP diphosphohydrolase
MIYGVVVLVDPRLDFALPARALPVLRNASVIYGGSDVDAERLGVEPVVDVDKLLAEPSVLLVTSREEPSAEVMLAAGAQLIESPIPDLVQAVSAMDRLRSPGGCPWDHAQTHDSLRKYLIEETYELLEAIEQDDYPAMREELGDVLLQVLFHSRIAQEAQENAFTIEDVAGDLVTKLVNRHPHIFDAAFHGQPTALTPEQAGQRWEDEKKTEKLRESIVDGVAFGQPASALAGKLGQRSGRAGIPLDLLPSESGTGAQLFRSAATSARAGVDPEGELRATAKHFASNIRAAESAARQAGVEPSTLEADGWRRFWPQG